MTSAGMGVMVGFSRPGSEASGGTMQYSSLLAYLACHTRFESGSDSQIASQVRGASSSRRRATQDTPRVSRLISMNRLTARSLLDDPVDRGPTPSPVG